jgi:hypothetical protein
MFCTVRTEPSLIGAAAKTTLKRGNDVRNVFCHSRSTGTQREHESENLGEAGKAVKGACQKGINAQDGPGEF